ncbi:MAG: type II secretion system protein GspK [Kiritimatiellia bacterium]|nr:type II secretion system protein GspK [Kiritimatiellia bacterium]
MISRSHSPDSHRKRRKRRSGGRQAVLSKVIGGMLIVMTLFFFLSSLIRKATANRSALLRFSLFCLMGSIAVYSIQWIRDVLAQRKVRRAAEHPFNRSAGPSGFALPLVLLVLGGLAILALHLAELGTALRTTHRRALTGESLRAAAWMGLQRGATRLARRTDPSVDSGMEEEQLVHPSGLRVTVRTLDENRRIDLNILAAERTSFSTAAARALELAFVETGTKNAAALVQTLQTAAVGESLTRDGAPSGTRKGRPFTGWPHVREIAGRPAPWPARTEPGAEKEDRPEVYDLMTLLPDNRGAGHPINLNTAPQPVLRALLGRENDSAIRALMEIREAEPLRSVAPLGTLIPQERWERIRDRVSVRGTLYRIVSVAENESNRVLLSAWLTRTPEGDFQIIR